MKANKYLGWGLIFSICFACNQTTEKAERATSANRAKVESATMEKDNSSKILYKAGSSITNEKIGDKIVDTIFQLPEVKERGEYITEINKGERHLKVWVANEPVSPDAAYYWIKVGEDNGVSLVTHFDFFVYPDSMRIMFYDIVNDKELTLSEWRSAKAKETK